MNDRNFAVPPPGKPAMAFAWILGAGFPLGIAVLLVTMARDGAIPPLLVLAGQALVAATVLLVLLPLWRRRVAFDGRRLRVESTYYTREAPIAEFDLDGARVVDLRERTELRPLLKSNGYALPGFRSGWFRTRQRTKLLAATAGGDRVLWVPTTQGYDLLLQPRSLQATLERMRELAAMARAGAGR